MEYAALRERVYQANMALQTLNLVIFTWGNVSEVDRDAGAVAIKPSGVDYEKMRPEDIVVLSLDNGKILSGELRPSSDTPTHLELYRSFEQVSGICHTHSTWATAWAQARRAVPAYGTTHADNFYGYVPCTRALTEAEITTDYELNTGRVIVETFRDAEVDPMAVPAVLVGSHGPFSWGTSAMDSVHNAKVLEECSKMAAITQMVNPQVTEVEHFLLDKHYLRKHGPGAYYGQG